MIMRMIVVDKDCNAKDCKCELYILCYKIRKFTVEISRDYNL